LGRITEHHAGRHASLLRAGQQQGHVITSIPAIQNKTLQLPVLIKIV
jgi:hypothetical protein